jgi:predicted negative regulator of RcsB-dependent stress response
LILRIFPLLIALLTSLGCAVTLAGQSVSSENQFGVSVTLFTTMAAINDAGYDADLDSEANYPIRKQVREELGKQTIPCLSELKAFYRDHRKGTDTATLSQYISFALLAGEPPDFKLDAGDLPPDVQPLVGFSDLLARFYKEANINDLWRRSQPAYSAAIERYQPPVVNALFEANGYLRNPTSGDSRRRFQIYLSLLASPNIVQVRNYKGEYFVVITPSYEPLVDEVRAAYLSYLLDPLSLRYSKTLETKKELQRYAEEAPALDLAYKDEFSLLVTKSLIKAIESRMMHGAEKRQAYVDQAMMEGFILTAAFSELLPIYEKQPEAMRLYYPDLVNAIDVNKERKRLKNIQFAETVQRPVIAPPPTRQETTEVERSLEQAESLLRQQDFANSRKLFEKSLQQTESKQMHSEAYFGLGRIAVQERQAEQANGFFEKVIALNSNPGMVAWSHVYLGRLAMLHDDSQGATNHFRKALAVDGAPDQVKEAAQNDLQKLSGEEEK